MQTSELCFRMKESGSWDWFVVRDTLQKQGRHEQKEKTSKLEPNGAVVDTPSRGRQKQLDAGRRWSVMIQRCSDC